MVRFLVEEAGANLTIPSYHNASVSATIRTNNADGSTPFIISCQQGNLEVMKYLLSQGANLTEIRNDGATCLSMACLNGHLDIVKYILQNYNTSSLISQMKNADQSPLWFASYNGSFPIVQYLVEEHMVLNVDNDTFAGEYPLIASCQGMHY